MIQSAFIRVSRPDAGIGLYGILRDVLPTFLILVLLIAVVLLAGFRRTLDKNGGRPPTSIPHLYGYTVMFLAIGFGSGSVTALPESVARLVSPLRGPAGDLLVEGESNARISLTSYDGYRATAAVAARARGWPDRQFTDGVTTAESIAEDTMTHVPLPDAVANEGERARYAAMRDAIAAAARVNDTSSLVSDLVGLIVCVLLYRAHARWLTAVGPE